MDVLLLTVINAGACLALPKLLSMVLVRKPQQSQPFALTPSCKSAKMEMTSFPYCTAYGLTGSQSCKFSPDFCSQCSPN
ncbi:hypothetical protein VB638_04235 [Dolichospermum sp. UHCC 0684]|jgi:hypothetical protein|uniref:hypothetical protein n=1 Tax=unclassified Dolichospermum TaxID=2622029 RepID=UPI0014488C6D|nr:MULTISPECIES: hypothetical protein [unclassified Dolichospermum]MEA5528803.1 hypothetical protein [Dolichospermum sp. UHCC 0684]MTJ33278.1 hypothetical protein [Dolichospermum sp. UHCC 0260]